MKYPIGTTYTPRRRNTYTATIVDYHVTRNLAGEIVWARYVSQHEFCGQLVIDRDVNETTIARGNPQPPKP